MQCLSIKADTSRISVNAPQDDVHFEKLFSVERQMASISANLSQSWEIVEPKFAASYSLTHNELRLLCARTDGVCWETNSEQSIYER